MPYRRRYTPKKRYPNRRYPNRSLASKAYALAKKAYKMPELKFYGMSLADTSPGTTASIEEITTIGQGSGNNQREGNTIHGSSLHIRGKFNINASATATQVRLIIFQWKAGAGGPATALDVLETSAITSFKSDNDRYKSNFLYDRVFQLDSVNKPEIYFQKKLKLKKNLISYPESTATAETNGVFAFLLSDEATNEPSSVIQCRLFYRDP